MFKFLCQLFCLLILANAGAYKYKEMPMEVAFYNSSSSTCTIDISEVQDAVIRGANDKKIVPCFELHPGREYCLCIEFMKKIPNMKMGYITLRKDELSVAQFDLEYEFCDVACRMSLNGNGEKECCITDAETQLKINKRSGKYGCRVDISNADPKVPAPNAIASNAVKGFAVCLDEKKNADNNETARAGSGHEVIPLECVIMAYEREDVPEQDEGGCCLIM